MGEHRKILKHSREAYQSLFDKKGAPYGYPAKLMGIKIERRDVYDFLVRYLDLISKTRMLSEVTRLVITGTHGSVSLAVEAFNREAPDIEKKNLTTSRSSIQYDTNKLLKYFEDDFIEQCLRPDCDLTPHIKALIRAEMQYVEHSKLLNNLALKLPRAYHDKEISDEDFDDIFKIIAPYSKNHMKYICDNIDIKSAGYLMYLLHSSELSKKDKERRNLLEKLLS